MSTNMCDIVPWIMLAIPRRIFQGTQTKCKGLVRRRRKKKKKHRATRRGYVTG